MIDLLRPPHWCWLNPIIYFDNVITTNDSLLVVYDALTTVSHRTTDKHVAFFGWQSAHLSAISQHYGTTLWCVGQKTHGRSTKRRYDNGFQCLLTATSMIVATSFLFCVFRHIDCRAATIPARHFVCIEINYHKCRCQLIFSPFGVLIVSTCAGFGGV